MHCENFCPRTEWQLARFEWESLVIFLMLAITDAGRGWHAFADVIYSSLLVAQKSDGQLLLVKKASLRLLIVWTGASSLCSAWNALMLAISIN